MNTSVDSIKLDFDAFRLRVEAYRKNYANPNLQKDSCEAAYDGLYRLNQRIKNELESGVLNKVEKNIFHEIINDNFLNGLLELRTVSAHIQSKTAQKKGKIQLYVPSGQQVDIPCEVSAGAAFSNNVFIFPKSRSGIDKINHLENLNTALERICKKFELTHNKMLGVQKGVAVSDRKYDNSRPRIPAEVERAAKVEAGHECAIKGCSEHTYLEIHHINENREDNRVENLILLCDKHHKMSHAGVIDRKSLKEYKNLLSIPDVGSLLDRFEKLESMLSMSVVIPARETISDKAINLILEEGVLLGNKLRGTREGNEVAQQIFSLIRAHGDQMGLDSVDLMVRRDDSYSRTGLSGLGILYDEFFEHAKSLRLIDHFEANELHDVAYYCALREHFPNERDMSACMKSTDFKYGGFRVADDNFDLISKYPNRGPSAVLDFLVYEGNSGEA